MASLLGAQNQTSGMGGLGLGSLGAAGMSSMLGMAATGTAPAPRQGFDMNNPVMAQLMLQQVSSV